MRGVLTYAVLTLSLVVGVLPFPISQLQDATPEQITPEQATPEQVTPDQVTPNQVTPERLKKDVGEVSYKVAKNTIPFGIATTVSAAVAKVIPKLGKAFNLRSVIFGTLVGSLWGLYDARETLGPLVEDIDSNKSAALDSALNIAINDAIPAITEAAENFKEDPQKSAQEAGKATADFARNALEDFFNAG